MTSKLFIACIASTILTTARSYALPNDSLTSVIDQFITSLKMSDQKQLAAVLDPALNFKVPHGNKVETYNKADVLADIKRRLGVMQNCETSYVILANSSAMALVRVDLRYDNVIKHNYITLQKDKQLHWKVTEICELFQDVEHPQPEGGSVIANN